MPQLPLLNEANIRPSSGNTRIDKLIKQIDTTLQEFIASYAGLTEDQMKEPGVCADWSVRDLIAHVTWWDQEALDHLPMILEGHRPPKYSVTYEGGMDGFNALMTEQKRHLTLDEVQQEFESTHAALVDYILNQPPERIFAQPLFRRRLKLDTFGHYPIHKADILTWRSQKSL